MRTPEETYIEVGDARLCVWRWAGDAAKQPILFLHATGFHARLWDAIIEEFPDHSCYAADLRFMPPPTDVIQFVTRSILLILFMMTL